MKYVVHVKYKSKVSLKNYLKNYLCITRFAFQMTEVADSQKLLMKLLTELLNIKTKLLLSAKHSLVKYYILCRNDSQFIIDSECFCLLKDKKKILLYGDSIVQTLGKDWYESRPKFSSVHFRSDDYIGDVVFSNFEIDSFNEIRELSIKESLIMDKVDRAISKRFSKNSNSFNVPILIDEGQRIIDFNADVDLKPSVSILIPTDFKKSENYGLEKSISSLLKLTLKIDMEIFLIFHKKKHSEFNNIWNKFQANTCIRGIEYDEKFNFSKVINKGVEASNFEIILMVNDDVTLDDKSDLVHFFEHLRSDKDLGSVGIRLFDDSGSILHAGLEYRNSEPQHFLKGSNVNFLKNAHEICREVSGCTGAFLAFNRTVFNKVGKMNEKFPIDFNDVDLMLKMERHGLKNLICSKVFATHAESLTRGITDSNVIKEDLNRLVDIHGKLPGRDPYLYTPADRILK